MKYLKIKWTNLKQLYICKIIYLFTGILGKYKHVDNNNILVIDMQLIGDSVMVSPIFRNLKLYNNIGKLDVVCRKREAEIYRRCEYINNVIIIDDYKTYTKNTLRMLKKIKYYFYLRKIALNYLPNIYNKVIVPRWDEDDMFSSILAYFTGVKFRYGFSEKVTISKSINNYKRDKYYTHTFFHDAVCHESDKFLDLISMIGYKVIDRNISINFNRVYEFLEFKIKKKSIVFVMDSSNKQKDWDIEKFVKVAEYMFALGWQVILLGTNIEYGKYFESKIGNKNSKNLINLIGKTTLGDAIDIIGSSSVYLGVDTGLSHIAAATQTPGIVLFSSSKLTDAANPFSVVRAKPKSSSIFIIQPEKPLFPCIDVCTSTNKAHCISQITVEEVISSIENIIERWKL